MAFSPNTLTNLVPDMIEAVNTVSREQTGFIPAVSIYAGSEGASKDQIIRIPTTSAMAAEAIVSANVIPDSGAQTLGNSTLTLSSAYAVPFSWSGEQSGSFVKNGSFSTLFAQQVSEAIRTLNNAIEADIAGKYVAASRAYGTAGTAPFASSLEDAAQMAKILDDNGAPSDRQLVIDTAAGVNLRSLANLSTAYAAGTDATLRQGTLLPLYGMDVRQSAAVKAHTAGAMTGFQIDASLAAGVSTLSFDGGTVNSTGCKAGDVVTIGSGGGTGTADSNKYVVTTGSTGTSGSIVIGAPGLKVAHVDNDEITIGSSYRANMAFSKSAIILGIRPPLRPLMGDMAEDVVYVTDPLTGIVYSVAMYKGYMGVRYQVEAVWGVGVIRPEWCSVLLG